MVKKITLFTLVLMLSQFAFADNENGEEGRSGNDDKAVRIDSVSGDTIYIEIDQVDDTLVFEDWEEPGKPSNSNENVMPTEEDDEDNGVQAGLHSDEGLVSEEIESHIGLKIYPNPVVSELHIQSDVPADNIKVTSMSGEVILLSEHTKTIDVRAYKSGLYFIELIFNDHTETMKFVKTP